MVESQTNETADQVRLAFAVGARSYVISLNKRGDVGGQIRITEAGKLLVDRALTRAVMPQSGLALTP
ncbi:MAG: hypothetical protein HY321_11690 [Armatimonadetes bacterium]|nr:hypothetical protein [Armatimonadota bacterium]